jgi:hypothetical protein
MSKVGVGFVSFVGCRLPLFYFHSLVFSLMMFFSLFLALNS